MIAALEAEVRALRFALDRIRTRTMIASAIAFDDFPQAERLIGEYVDAELARLRS